MTRAFSLSVIALAFSPWLLVAGEDFVGEWVNTDDKTGGLTRLGISKKVKGWAIQAWGPAEAGRSIRAR